MKPILILTAGWLTARGIATSQTPAEPAVKLATARIIGSVSDGTPAPPTPPQPQYIVTASDIVETQAIVEGGRTVTIQRIKPLSLPPPLEPATPTEPVVLPTEMRDVLEKARSERLQNYLWMISATIYHSANTAPRTLVHQWGQGGKSVTYWSSADFGLIAGIHAFADENDRNHSLIMGWGRVDLERTATFEVKTGRAIPIPAIPDFTEGSATWQLVGEAPDAPTQAFIQTLHALYNKEHRRLQAAYEGREAARRQAETYARANPRQPKDITVRFWRTETPTAQRKGGIK